MDLHDSWWLRATACSRAAKHLDSIGTCSRRVGKHCPASCISAPSREAF